MRRQGMLAAGRSARAAGVELDADADVTKTWKASGATANDTEGTDSDDVYLRRAHDVAWGPYKFNYVPSTTECVEDGVNTWEGKSLFETWSGTDTGLTITDGTTRYNGRPAKTQFGLRIYKAACPNSTTVKVGGMMEIPADATEVEIIFGITRRCTGDCAPFMVSVLDAATDHVKHRWCWNREGHEPAVQCDVNHTIPSDHMPPSPKWNRVKLNITDLMDSSKPSKLALEIYTSGDFRNLPTLPGEVGLGGRAMVLIDTLTFTQTVPPETLFESSTDNSGYDAQSLYCKQPFREVCGTDSWCFEKYRCYSGWCIEGNLRCNEFRNCPDDSDEVGCEYKNGFHAEFFLHHARQLQDTNVDVLSLTNPDLRLLDQEIEYDADDFWEKIHARDNFAVRWRGNLSLTAPGHYSFTFNTDADSTAKLRVQGLGVHSHNAWNVTSDSWITMPANIDLQLTLTYVHLRGPPHIDLQYTGADTQGSVTKLTKLEMDAKGQKMVTATMTGSRCDTMHCNLADALVLKPVPEKILCNSVPCTQVVDTRTCCTRQYKVVACGDYRTCALDMHGRPVCWGSWTGFNEQWKTHPGPFTDISTRGKYICAVLESTGMVDCWQPDHVSAPLVEYSLSGQFKNISVGGDHTCALRDTGYPACTGSSEHDQIYPPSNIEFTRVSAGETFSCGITVVTGTSDGSVKCWGANERGQATPPAATAHAYTHLAAGHSHACGITNGSAVCWGWNNEAQATPPSGYDFTQVAAGGMHTCALKADGNAVCWGANAEGQSSPVQEDAPYLTISAGKTHTCAIRKDHEIVCWGSNFEEDIDGSLMWRGQSEPPAAAAWER